MKTTATVKSLRKQEIENEKQKNKTDNFFLN